jgi:hypothetical protein
VRKADRLVVAVSGGPEMVVGDVAVRIYSRTEVDYLARPTTGATVLLGEHCRSNLQ